MSKKKAKKPTFFLRLRTYPEGIFVTLWVCGRSGPAVTGLLCGDLLPDVAEAVILSMGLPVEREHLAMPGIEPMTQQELFADQPEVKSS